MWYSIMFHCDPFYTVYTTYHAKRGRQVPQSHYFRIGRYDQLIATINQPESN